jgi:hypothetical protein
MEGPLDRVCTTIDPSGDEGKETGKCNGESQSRPNKQMMSDQPGRLGFAGAEKSTMGRADSCVGPGIRSGALLSFRWTKTERDIATLCRLCGGSSSAPLVICHTVRVIDHNMGDLWGHSRVTFRDPKGLEGIEEGGFFIPSFKSMPILGSVMKIERLSFGFCEILDGLDFATECPGKIPLIPLPLVCHN